MSTLTQCMAEPATIPFRQRYSPPSQGVTLQDCWDRFSAIELRNRSSETTGEYRTHLNRFEQFWAWEQDRKQDEDPCYTRTTCPVVGSIGRQELLAFDAWLEGHVRNRQGDPISARAINKHVATILRILGWAHKRDLLDRLPSVDKRRVRKAARKLHLSLEEADALKRACRVARWPSGLQYPASLYWETLVVGYCVQGFRTQEQVRYEARHRSLEWSGISWDPQNPHEDGKAEHPWGWLSYWPDKNWSADEPPLTVPIHESYHVHLRAISDARVTHVFPFPLSNKSFYDQWSAIVRAAGIEPKPDWRGNSGCYQIKHLRKSAVKWINDADARRVIAGLLGDPEPAGELLSSQAVGHTEAVSRRNYDFADDRLVMAYQSLPVPDSFREPLTGRVRQMTLF